MTGLVAAEENQTTDRRVGASSRICAGINPDGPDSLRTKPQELKEEIESSTRESRRFFIELA